MKQPIIGFDVDDVLAEMAKEWIRRYNQLYHDNVKWLDCKQWDFSPNMTKCTKEELYDILRADDFYDFVQPVPGAQEAVKACRKLGRVVFVTSCLPGTVEAKWRWLTTFGFVEDTPAARRDFMPITDKSLANVDMLFDDNVDNVLGCSGEGVLICRPHNEKRIHEVCLALRDVTGTPRMAEFLINHPRR